jgi:hypothetical protein
MSLAWVVALCQKLICMPLDIGCQASSSAQITVLGQLLEPGCGSGGFGKAQRSQYASQCVAGMGQGIRIAGGYSLVQFGPVTRVVPSEHGYGFLQQLRVAVKMLQRRLEQ